MKKFSSIALALSVAFAMGAPASANFFEFNYTFANGETLVGTSSPGTGASGSSFAADDLSWTFNGNAATLLTGSITSSSGNDTWSLPNDQSNFNVSTSQPFTFTRTGTASGSAGGGIVAWQAGGSFYSLANDTGALRGVTETGQGTYQVQSVEVLNVALTDASVERVPEINGSGFAYIAFILGALGLWLYSGAGRGRLEEDPVAT